MKAKVAVFGAYTIGMTIQCEKFPVGGETVPGHNFQMLHGGKGSNQAVAASRMGAEVLFGTCVGNDSFGDMCMQLYEQEHDGFLPYHPQQKGQSHRLRAGDRGREGGK